AVGAAKRTGRSPERPATVLRSTVSSGRPPHPRRSKSRRAVELSGRDRAYFRSTLTWNFSLPLLTVKPWTKIVHVPAVGFAIVTVSGLRSVAPAKFPASVGDTRIMSRSLVG